MEQLFFIKLLIVLCLISMICLIGKKINEHFSTLYPNTVPISIDTNKRKTKLNIKWSKDHEDITDYYLILFINNDGPYVITLPHLDVSKNDSFNYDFNDVKMNVEYKFAMLAWNGRGLSNIDKFVKAKLTPPGLQIEYINDAMSKIVCNSDGTHTLSNSKKCKSETDIIEAKSINYTQDGNINETPFNNNSHNELMRTLRNEPKIKLNFL
jgi:hypothetical protein